MAMAWAPRIAPLGPVLNSNSFDEHSVEGAIAGLEGGTLRADQPAERVIERGGRQVGVELGEGIAQPLFKDDLAVVSAFGGGCVRGNVRPVGDAPAGAGKPRQAGGFDLGFSDRGHG